MVQFYQMRRLAELRPRWEYWGIPKMPEQLVPKALPFMNYVFPEKLEDISSFMQEKDIPLLTTFHIAEHVEKIIDSVHDIGAKILDWQTIHMHTDRVFNCKRLNDMDGFVAPTRYAMQTLVKYGGVDKDKISIIPHGVDLNKFYPHKTSLRMNYGIKDEQKVILYSGRLFTWKGIHNVIPIMRRIINRYNAIFIIRGQPSMNNKTSKKLNYVLSHIARRNPNVIYMPQWLPPEFMEELFATSDIVLFPSGSEGFGVPTIEAMACGKPVVVTDLANTREIAGYGTGMLLEPKEEVRSYDEEIIKVPTSESIEGALSYLLENPEEMKIMGSHGFARAKLYFDLTKVCKSWVKLIDAFIPLGYNMKKELVNRLLAI